MFCLRTVPHCYLERHQLRRSRREVRGSGHLRCGRSQALNPSGPPLYDCEGSDVITNVLTYSM